MNNANNDEIFVLSPWGCLCAVLTDFGIDTSHITPRMGELMVDDFMQAMIKAGHIAKRAEDDG